jgi:ABC-type branched-subunit amino acid transport system substrate-binding protein
LRIRSCSGLSAAVCALVVLASTACGGDGESEGAAAPTPTDAPTPVPTIAPGVTPGPGVTDTEIRLGMTSDLSGAGSTPYGQVTLAIQAYFAMVNAEEEGVCGRDLTLVAKDDQYDKSLALERTKELVEKDGVLAIIGALGTQPHLPVADYLNDPNADGDKSDGVPDLFVSTGYSGWGDTTRWPWTAGFIPDYQADAQVLTGYINDTFAGKRLGILYQNDEFGNDYLLRTKEVLADRALLVSEQAYEPTGPEIAPFITSFIDAGAEVILLATPPEVSARAIAAAHRLEYSPQFVLSYVNSHTHLATLIGGGSGPDQLAVGLSELNGAVSTNYLLSAIEDEDDPAVTDHLRIMQTYQGPPVSTLSIYGQSIAETVVEVLRRACHNPTRYGMVEAAQSLQKFHPSLLWPGIDINLSAQDHRAIQSMQVVILSDDGTLQEIGEPVSVE